MSFLRSPSHVSLFLRVLLYCHLTVAQQFSAGLNPYIATEVINEIKYRFPSFEYSLQFDGNLKPRAFNDSGKIIVINNALISSQFMTRDLLTLILLHEIGHSLAQEGPKYSDGIACEDVADAWAVQHINTIWGRPSNQKESIYFKMRLEAAVKLFASTLSSWESETKEIDLLNPHNYTYYVRETHSCDHSTPVVRRKKMLLTLDNIVN